MQIKTVFNSLLSWLSLCYAITTYCRSLKFSKLNFLTECFEMKREIIRNCTSTQMCIDIYVCVCVYHPSENYNSLSS